MADTDHAVRLAKARQAAAETKRQREARRALRAAVDHATATTDVDTIAFVAAIHAHLEANGYHVTTVTPDTGGAT